MKFAIGVIAAATIWTGNAGAQDGRAAEEALETARADIVVTAARTTLPASALPLTVDVIDRETLSRHVWMTPAVQELSCSDEHRSGASMCSACSRSTAWLLALMKSADRIPNHVIALEALCSPGFVRSPV